MRDPIQIVPVPGGYNYIENGHTIYIRETPSGTIRRFRCTTCNESDCHHVYCVLSEIANAEA